MLPLEKAITSMEKVLPFALKLALELTWIKEVEEPEGEVSLKVVLVVDIDPLITMPSFLTLVSAILNDAAFVTFKFPLIVIVVAAASVTLAPVLMLSVPAGSTFTGPPKLDAPAPIPSDPVLMSSVELEFVTTL